VIRHRTPQLIVKWATKQADSANPKARRDAGCEGSGGKVCSKDGHDGRVPLMSLYDNWPRPHTRNLKNAATEYFWLNETRCGVGMKGLANRAGVSVRRVRLGLASARTQARPALDRNTLRPPRLIPLFPIGPYTPHSSCAHRQPIRAGSVLCCMVCHSSGVDDHPALWSGPGGSPTLENTRSVDEARRETRRQRRLRLFGARAEP
jgi:hypothetical protein